MCVCVWGGGGGYRFLTGEKVPLRLGLLTRPVSDVDPDSLIPNDFHSAFFSVVFCVLGNIAAVCD